MAATTGSSVRPRPTRLQASEPGTFLTDGRRLIEVLADKRKSGFAWVVDCTLPPQHTQLFAEEMKVSDLTRCWRLITPEPD